MRIDSCYARRRILQGMATLPLLAVDPTIATGSSGSCWRASGPLDHGKPTMFEVWRQPLLMNKYYRISPGGQIAENGAAGGNRFGIGMIEEQRLGGRYVMHGILSNRPDWVELGWKVLDYGISLQEASGHYQTRGADYHSISMFLTGLMYACLADPARATCARLNSLHAACRWMVNSMSDGIALNAPYTHRSFLCMAVLGRGADMTGDASLLSSAKIWAERGLRAQLPNGINPEHGGYDMSYQMVGPLCALFYLPVCWDASLAERLRTMVSNAVNWWLQFVEPDGTVPMRQSTRIGKERQIGGKVKIENYQDAVETLVWAAVVLGDEKLLEPAALVANHR